MTPLEALALGITAGALLAAVWSERAATRLQDRVADLVEELEDVSAERDAYRWQMETALDEAEARRTDPGRTALRAVGGSQ